MRRKRRIFQHSNTQDYPLREHIDLYHPLVELADMIDWGQLTGSLPSRFSLDADRVARFFGRGSSRDFCTCSMHSIISDSRSWRVPHAVSRMRGSV